VNWKVPTFLLLFIHFAVAGTAAAADIKVLSAVPLCPGVSQLSEQYKRGSGHNVMVQSVTTGDINKVLSSNEPFDILITTTALIDQSVKDGRSTDSTRSAIGRVGIGVIVRRSRSDVPDISSTDALTKAVLAADTVVFNMAGSGQYVQSLFEKLGILSRIRNTSRPSNAAQTMEAIINGKGNDIGFGLISEIKPYEEKGVRFLGPLPQGLQNYTTYEAVISSGSKVSDAAKEFIRFLTTSAAKDTFAKTGVD
jgi:molybdate transport system substrate-binding protein